MLFNSYEFLIFLPFAFCGYWFIFTKLKVQNFFILAISYLFYGYWDWRFLVLLFLTTILCYWSGLFIFQTTNKKKRKLICGINIGINIAILCYFKYFNFFADNLRIIFEQFGYQLDWFTLDVLLPVGISFYTFQAISYPIDVYRDKISASSDFIAFASFISFFPQLVAGPIERSTNLLPQFLRSRHFDYGKAVDGMRQILWGFFKKIVIADNCAMLANKVFENYGYCEAPTLILGAFFFSFQIYGDFSGYSDIAIGVANLFGIKLSVNFHYPYFSNNIAEFWRRWHISLNTWFRDYVYIPLGGSRCKKIKIIRNIMIIFLLSGLWHGANWTFIVWGIFNGILFLPLILSGRNRYVNTNLGLSTFSTKILDCLNILVTFIITMIGWVIFRSETIYDAITYLSHMFSKWGLSSLYLFDGVKTIMAQTFIMIMFFVVLDWICRKKYYGLQVVEGKSIVFRWGMYIAVIFSILIFAGQQEQFIYFQF